MLRPERAKGVIRFQLVWLKVGGSGSEPLVCPSRALLVCAVFVGYGLFLLMFGLASLHSRRQAFGRINRIQLLSSLTQKPGPKCGKTFCLMKTNKVLYMAFGAVSWRYFVRRSSSKGFRYFEPPTFSNCLPPPKAFCRIWFRNRNTTPLP